MRGPRIKSGAGFDPRISLTGARRCQINRDGRDKPGHDDLARLTTESIASQQPCTAINPIFTMTLCRCRAADYIFVMARWRSGDAKAVHGLAAWFESRSGLQISLSSAECQARG